MGAKKQQLWANNRYSRVLRRSTDQTDTEGFSVAVKNWGSSRFRTGGNPTLSRVVLDHNADSGSAPMRTQRKSEIKPESILLPVRSTPRIAYACSIL